MKSVLNRYANINEIPDNFKKASFELSVTNNSFFSIYQTFAATIEIPAYKKDDGTIIYNSCEADDTYESIIDTKDINCIVTSVTDGIVSISTDYESRLFLHHTKTTESDNFLGQEYEFTEYVEPYEDSGDTETYEKYNCLSDFDFKEINIKSGVIGNLSGETFDNVELSGYGIMLNDNAYFTNPYIRNEIYYIELNDNYTLEITGKRDYSILSNGYTVSLPESKLNGLVINIYANDYISLDNGDGIQKDDYASYRLIPISNDNYK